MNLITLYLSKRPDMKIIQRGASFVLSIPSWWYDNRVGLQANTAAVTDRFGTLETLMITCFSVCDS